MPTTSYNPKQYWESRLSRMFNLEGVGFDSFGASYNKWIYKMAQRNLETLIDKGVINPQHKEVLDIGCGTGFYVDIWSKYGVKGYEGIDISSTSIRNLRGLYPYYKFYEMDIGNVVNFSHSFDIVTAFAVLFHITDDVKFMQAIKNISNLCADKGMVLITDIFPHKRRYTIKHQKSRTLREYESILSVNGLQVINRLPVHYLLNAPLDISNGFMQKIALNVWWKYCVGGLELTTHSVGALFYGLDTILTKLKESPSTEMLICKKI